MANAKGDNGDFLAIAQEKLNQVAADLTAFANDKFGSVKDIKLPDVDQLLDSWGIRKTVDDTLSTVRQEFARFEEATGTVLPDTANPEADRLREKMAAMRAIYEKELKAAQQATSAQQELVQKLVENYETEAKGWVERHEDALQFKFLAQDMAKEAHRQRDHVEDLMENEMKQYSLQAKDCAAQVAMVAYLTRHMFSGQPFEEQLSGLLSFQKLSKLANANRDVIIEPIMIHEQIKAYAAKGVPNKSQLYHRFEELYPRVQASTWQIPDSGLVGQIWQKASSKLASEDTGLYTIRGYLAQGNVRMAREWLQHWMAANMTLKKDLPSSDVPEQLRHFAEDIDVNLRCGELSRYLKAKLLAQQKSLLQ